MNVLVIGGSGFVSGTLARTALAEGHRVWTVTRGERDLVAGCTHLIVDRHDAEAFDAAVAGAGMTWDLVADCIAYKPEDIRQDIAAFRERARHLVFVSTDFVYDPTRRTFPQSEENAHHLLPGSYGGDKRASELELIGGDTGDMTWTILRPCHIYGPGSLLGCLPVPARDPEVIDRILRGEALKLVGGGHFLQQPIFARDLAHLILSTLDNDAAAGDIFNAAGPDIIESRTYYEIIAETLGTEATFEEVPVDAYLAENPGRASALCHRIYDLTRLRAAGLRAPATPIADGLREHVESLRK